MKKLLLVCLTTLLSVAAFAQTGTVKGRILDRDNGEGLVGANVVLKGKLAVGAMTDINGNFTIHNVEAGKQTFVVSFIGFLPKEVEATVQAGGVTDLGSINVAADAIGLKEVEVMASIAQDRKTPVAVSTVKAEFIEAKIGAQEFPEILKTTPGVYVTRQGGGFGDSRLTMRGFNSENVAVMINGVPVNDMENGRVYWSNWAGMSDVTSYTQVQRGLGASKLAVPSIGGTMNIMTKTTDAEKGGSFYTAIGSYGYLKQSLNLSTGLTEDNWAVTVLGARTSGDGYVEGTEFEGWSYFLNISKIINDSHQLSFTGFGAPQWHGQRRTRNTINVYRNAPQGILFNPDWGYLNGQVTHARRNFYHKPQFSLNHYWTINERSELSTSVYASVGTGGGTSLNGSTFRTSNEYSPIDFDQIVAQNAAQTESGSATIMQSSRNDHNWYGVLSSYNTQLTSNISVNGGVDFRYYQGRHFTEVADLLGGDYYLDKRSDINNRNKVARVGDKIRYNNDGIVLWEGVFTQAEYSKDRLSAFVALAASNTSYKRIDYFKYSGAEQATDFVNFFGYSGKGGVNYNLTEHHNMFANAGYFEKAPFMNAVFMNNSNTINADAENQKILSYELGYGYRSSILSANVNLYNTLWKDRTFTRSIPVADNEVFYANILGVNALHQGVEIDFQLKPVKKLRIGGMASFGDWRWQNNLEDVVINDQNQIPRDTISLYIADLKVGDAAQTTMALTADYEVITGFSIGGIYNYYDDLYAYYDIFGRGTAPAEGQANEQAYKMPAYSVFDFNAKYDFDIAGLNASIYANVTNLFDTEYIADANDASEVQGLFVYYGAPRMWTLGTRIRF